MNSRRGKRWRRYKGALNAISAKHFDFLLCDPGDCAVRVAIELDDSSHGSARAWKRDHFLNNACEAAGLPLLRVKAARSYDVADIRRQIDEAVQVEGEFLSLSALQ